MFSNMNVVCTEDIHRVCYRLYDNNNLAAAIASGSFKTDAMVIVPCSMHSLGAIANGISHNLLIRAAGIAVSTISKIN